MTHLTPAQFTAAVDQGGAHVRDLFDELGLSVSDATVRKTVLLFAASLRAANESSDPELLMLAVIASFLEAVR